MYEAEEEVFAIRRLKGRPSTAAIAAAAVESGRQGSPRASHSPDFASINWFGKPYGFTPTQRRIVAVLWQAWEQGTPDVSEQTILREAESDSGGLRMLFRGSPAWDELIQRSSWHGGPAGCFRLAAPVVA
jgi:hypothetical protein